MKKTLIAIFSALSPVVILAANILSDFVRADQHFFTYASWVPTSVRADWTPGSSSTIGIVTTTNWYASAWQLSSSSRPYWGLGTYPYDGSSVPTWNGSEWSGAYDICVDTSSSWRQGEYTFYLSQQSYRDDTHAYDEHATELTYGATGYIVKYPPGSTEADDYIRLYFERMASNVVTAVTNVRPARLTPELHASFFRTLDGWCEREYFAGLAYPESSHTLTSTRLNAIGDGRECTTRRFVGTTNMWSVANAIMAIPTNGWRVARLPSDYMYRVTPYWSSQTFDSIYSRQIPSAINWSSDGLTSLSNKCAILDGLADTDDIWAGSAVNGFLFDEMYPTNFGFGLRRYDCDRATPGHAFGFYDLCATNHVPMLYAITNKTHRLNMNGWAAVNQVMSELNRTINPVHVSASTGSNIVYNYTREYSTTNITFDAAGFEWDSESHGWYSSSDVGFSFSVSSNYSGAVVGQYLPDSRDSDSIVLSGNSVSLVITPFAYWGSWRLPAQGYIDALNQARHPGTTNVDYHITFSTDTSYADDYFLAFFECNGYVFPYDRLPRCPTNTSIKVNVSIQNKYSVSLAGAPDFEHDDFMPMDQAWGAGAGGRVDEVNDVCTASMACIEESQTNVTMHCNPIVRTYSESPDTTHMREWTAHRSRMQADITSKRGIDWTDMASYIGYSASDILGILNSIKIQCGLYTISWAYPQWASTGVILRVDENGTWYNHSGNDIVLTPIYGRDFTWLKDASAHTIPTREPIAEHCRQRIMNIVDWEWNSVHKQ